MKRLVVDIDNTLIKSEYIGGEYIKPEPIIDEITKLNDLYRQGWIIILWSGRSWIHYEITVSQSKNFGIKYHTLLLGKPIGIYIDADAKTTLKDIE
jgi:hypothetical protein